MLFFKFLSSCGIEESKYVPDIQTATGIVYLSLRYVFHIMNCQALDIPVAAGEII